MYFNFACSNCGKTLKVREELAGRKAKCPYCRAAVNVPDQTAAESAAREDAETGTAGSGAAAVAPAGPRRLGRRPADRWGRRARHRPFPRSRSARNPARPPCPVASRSAAASRPKETRDAARTTTARTSACSGRLGRTGRDGRRSTLSSFRSRPCTSATCSTTAAGSPWRKRS